MLMRFIARHLHSIFWLLFCTATCCAASLNQKYNSPEEFIADQKVIRITVDNTPGFGNQAASVSVMARLRQMGFKGKFELIYANLTTPKIITLFNLPQILPDDYFDAKQGIEFIKLKEFVKRHKDQTLERYSLGMSGADDDFGCSLAQKDGIDVEHHLSELDCLNIANLTNVQLFAELTPFYRESNYIYLLNDNDPKPDPQENSFNKFLITPVADLNQAKDYLENDASGQELLKQKPALAAFINGMEKQIFNTLPAYGYTIQADVCGLAGCFPGNILQIIAGARYAQLNGYTDFHKPLIIPIFYDYDKEAKELIELIHSDNWGQYEQSGAEQARNVIKQLGIPDILYIANISDPATIKKIDELKEGQILLLSMGPLPKIVFDGLYNYTNTNVWPQIREGANSLNSLILTGKPHFRCGYDWEIGFDLVDDPTLKARLQHFYGTFCKGMSSWKNDGDSYRSLGELIIDSNNPNSSFSRYFQRLKEEAQKSENDRIYYALEKVVSMINKDK